MEARRLGPWPSRIKILEPVLSDSMGRTVVSAKSITIDELDLVGLLNNRLSARSIRIDTPVTKLISLPNPESHASSDELLNISEMFWPPGGRIDDGHPSQLDLDLTEIDIRNGMFVLDNPSRPSLRTASISRTLCSRRRRTTSWP